MAHIRQKIRFHVGGFPQLHIFQIHLILTVTDFRQNIGDRVESVRHLVYRPLVHNHDILRGTHQLVPVNADLLSHFPRLLLIRRYGQHLPADKTSHHLPVRHDRGRKLHQSCVAKIGAGDAGLRRLLRTQSVTLFTTFSAFLCIPDIFLAKLRKSGRFRLNRAVVIRDQRCNTRHIRKRILYFLQGFHIYQICQFKFIFNDRHDCSLPLQNITHAAPSL